MRDLPFELLGRALWFVVANLFTLFRLCWFPIAVLLATQVALGQALAALAGGTTRALLEVSPFSEPAFLLSAALQTIALSVVAVRVHRLVLFGDRQPGQYFLFAFGKTEASYVAMVVLLVAGVFAIPIVLAGSIGLLNSVVRAWGVPSTGGSFGGFVATSLPVALAAASIFLAIWFVLRMSLWPVVVVAKGGLAPVEAWRLTRGYAVPLFWLFFVAQFVLSFLFLIGVVGSGDTAVLSTKVLDRYLMFGGWLNPDVHPFASGLTAERLAIEFGLSFFVTAFMAALLSFTFLNVNQEQATPHVEPSLA